MNETERIEKLHLQKRLEKAIEYKQSLKKMGIVESQIPCLQEFSKILNEWVKDGKSQKGKFVLAEYGKRLEYELLTPKFTYIRLRQL